MAPTMNQSGNVGLLGSELQLQGRLWGKGDIVIEGKYDGEISLDGTLIVGAEGQVTAPVQARAVKVQGLLQGPVAASDVSVQAGGRLVGDVRAASVGLDDGGSLDGTVEMDFELPAELAELDGGAQ